ncbi:uncharacterized protein N0V89_011257 [Didymosphaeria variabile]|uniref:Heterokaryon incompatibility domain-containing protein n=1 Tax=Didymosphaeria variabile TaxID=1932322 RepID=A0A9W9C7W0_9PLEO|nr:uncharacterized protein N0V89_011257 [Didymosphaeria variabile]KAJ4347317.1 hypothetical protein N0V89_011257 [Didymosphaeria variabile]
MSIASSDDIRLVTLLPGVMADPIQCQLKVATLQTKYEALSYVWGSESDARPISVNDHELHVTFNLESALRRLRMKKQQRVLWVDALCINQEDIPEKESQIPRMRKIYECAETVIVWLGPSTPEMRAAYESMKSRPDLLKPENIMKKESREIMKEFGKGFFEPVWWTRLWVIQEVLVARKLVVIRGQISFSWNFLEMTLGKNVTGKVNPFAASMKPQIIHHPMHYFCFYRARLARGETIHLLGLIKVFYRHESKLPKDRVYGLLNIAADGDDIDLYPDYSSSDSDVFKRVAKHSILKYKNLDFIFLGRGPGRLADLPTWTPDLTIPWERTPYSLLPSKEPVIFAAAAKTVASPVFSEDLARMTVTGVCEDVISKVSVRP